MKGIELPINALVIIVVAVLVLLGIIALWFGSWGGGVKTVSLETAKQASCQIMVEGQHCDASGGWPGTPNFDANENGKTYPTATEAAADGDTFNLICNNYYNIWTEDGCKALCGC